MSRWKLARKFRKIIARRKVVERMAYWLEVPTASCWSNDFNQSARVSLCPIFFFHLPLKKKKKRKKKGTRSMKLLENLPDNGSEASIYDSIYRLVFFFFGLSQFRQAKQLSLSLSLSLSSQVSQTEERSPLVSRVNGTASKGHPDRCSTRRFFDCARRWTTRTRRRSRVDDAREWKTRAEN